METAYPLNWNWRKRTDEVSVIRRGGNAHRLETCKLLLLSHGKDTLPVIDIGAAGMPRVVPNPSSTKKRFRPG